MSFKFNFSGDDKDLPDPGQSSEEIKWFECECVEVTPNIKMDLDSIAGRAKMFICGDVEIGHVMAKEAVVKIGDNGLNSAIELAEKDLSDLVAGKYEGGLKIWECTSDLLNYLIANPDEIEFESVKFMDLGCGAGILGIYAFMLGSHVTFQDYNKEVLENLTIPNVLLNTEDDKDREDVIKTCKFYSGDWASFNKKLPDRELYDVILTSETIYNPANYRKLIQLFIQRLAKGGIAYVAAKTHYFGVGGGMRQFEMEIQNSGMLKAEVCWKLKTSGGIQREILKVTRNNVFVVD